ncbi:hypothetical protein [Demequina lutea]|uniref:Uncharacterized protein n=1 Tax=Demequina lutea TaxID=431489 RepID=A0A7Y9ZA44_9MICO|nr:hypothetical protein [Demequina lutea]NYI41406.1 hypothetical protein [Demequina lutea]
MATMTKIASALVLDRFRDSFKNDKGETVEYAQARLFDTVTREFTVVSTLDIASLVNLTPGETVGPLEFEFVENFNIRAQKVRPVGNGGRAAAERF